ncbi:mechanosensitive ion channel protein MscS [Parazoarcus communis]|uniref:Mechanosensitive ion channel protein MscS n=1 Tax=Parazoarcus communis TaxID=41977 RepID=A0A2U8GNW7_9RHOO|nr:mechanosensitive ion channel domain-containing protein [Parazoarcus communis]AWI75311.1 mechanosensitive ion channel protein MscS [Parazoarcus communis]
MQQGPNLVALADNIARAWSGLGQAAMLRQLAVIVCALVVGWFIQRAWDRRLLQLDPEPLNSARRFGQHGAKRVLFPLTALLLVVVARAVLARYQPVHLLDLAVPLLTSLAVIRFVVFALRQAVGRTSWLGALERFVSALAWSVVALYILGWLPEVIEGLDSMSITLGGQKLSAWTLMKGLTMVLLTLLVAMWLAGVLERRLAGATGLDASVRLVLTRVMRALLILVAFLVALPMVGINLTTLSVFGGALGVGLGFGMQKIAANYVSGFIILVDRSLRIGNLISVGAERGVVKEITTRYTVIRAPNGIESIVPNEVLVSSVVQNETFSDTQVALPLVFQVSYDADLDQALAILVAVAGTQPRVLADPAPKAFLTGFGDNGINLRLGCWIADPQEGTLAITSEINMEVWRRFKAAGIGIPYPQREVRLLPPLSPAPAVEGFTEPV